MDDNIAILEGLNEEQRQAVCDTEGPMIIIAGAGTGKTRVVTHRIAFILKTHPHFSASNVLGLTFSKKASDEMHSRVEDLIGEYKDELWISTFHSFCHKVLRNHPHQAGLPTAFKLLDKIEQWIFFNNILPQLKLVEHMRAQDPTECINGFVQFINRAKDELADCQEYNKYANKIADQQERKKALETARVYSIYQQQMAKNGFLDFGDLILKTLDLFRTNKDILQHYQDKFKYIMVDEFQDTNVSQIELICTLAQKHKNICVVGDDDQGIYRFRGASYASFIKFKENFPQAKQIILSENYRSTQNILSTAGRLIKENDIDRFNPQKKLWTRKEKGEKVKVFISADFEHEAKVVSESIRKIYDSLPEDKKDFSNIAVLYRAHMHKDALLEELKKQRIPYVVIGKIGLFDTEEAKDLISFLTILENPKDSVRTFRVLRLPCFNIELPDLTRISALAKRNNTDILDITETSKELSLSEKSSNGIRKFMDIRDKLVSSAYDDSALGVFRNLIILTDYIKALTTHPTQEKEAKIINVSRLFNFIKNFCDRNDDNTLASFLRYLDYFLKAGGDYEEEESLEKTEGVRLMTVHQAKGLEFPYVFVLSMVSQRFPTRQRLEPVPFPVELMKENLPKGDYHIEEERRLCYVAMTRAKKELLFSAIDKNRVKPSVFLQEIKESAPSFDDIEELLFQKENLYQDLKEDFIRKEEAEINMGSTTIGPAVPLRTSFTQLETYQNCPLKFKFAYIYNIPTLPKAPLGFGKIMHDVLEEFYRKTKQDKMPALEELLEIYSSKWKSSGFESKLQEEEYKKQGHCILKEFYLKNKDQNIKPVFLEEEFNLKIDGHILKGVIDRVDLLADGTVEIIDYKTGTAKEKKDIQKSLQLEIYAMACLELFKYKPSLLSIYNLTTNEKISVTKSTQELEESKNKIRRIIQDIESRNFQPIPEYRKCSYCDFNVICPATKA